MENLFLGDVVEMLPNKDSIVFSFIENVTSDGKRVVNYKQINFESGRTGAVNKKIYKLAKFGAGYESKEISKFHHIGCISAMLQNGNLFIGEGMDAEILSPDNIPIWHGDVTFNGEFPTGVAAEGNDLWFSYKLNGVVTKFNVASCRHELIIGGSKGEYNLYGPAGLFCEDGFVYICCSVGKNIWKINTKTFEAENYAEFTGSPIQFLRVSGIDCALLKSGIYLI